MDMIVEKGRAAGSVTLPSSKSIAHRLLINAALTDGTTVVKNFSLNEDIKATADCLTAMGARIEINGGSITVSGTEKAADDGVRRLRCRESGSTLRFMLPLCLDGVKTELYGSERLIERPHTVYRDICEKNGFLWQCDGEKITVQGKLTSGVYEVPGNISSQFITGLMLALPTLEGDSLIRLTTQAESLSYIEMTVDSLKKFGIEVNRISPREWAVPGGQKRLSPEEVSVEADESGAAFFGALNCLGGDVKLLNLNENSVQGDRVWRELFDEISSHRAEISIKDCPDLGPILMALAACKNGAVLTDTARLRIKESNRGQAMAQELAKLGVSVEVGENTISVSPQRLHAPTEKLCGHNDHRIVMSLAILLTQVGGVIDDAQSVSKSMPQFWDLLQSLGIKEKQVDL